MATFSPKDHANDDGREFTPIPPGDYFARVDTLKRKVSKNGNEYLEITWKVVGPECAGRLVWDQCTLTPKSLWKLGNLCLAVGHTEPFDYDVNSQVSEALSGRLAKVSVSEEMGRNDKARNTVKRYVAMDDEEYEAYKREERDPSPVQDGTSGSGSDKKGSGRGRTREDGYEEDVPF